VVSGAVEALAAAAAAPVEDGRKDGRRKTTDGGKEKDIGGGRGVSSFLAYVSNKKQAIDYHKFFFRLFDNMHPILQGDHLLLLEVWLNLVMWRLWSYL
jgi:hypothetical protein